MIKTSTPVHNGFNPDLLRFIPKDSKYVVEVGCSSGALAREFKVISPSAWYVGTEINERYAAMAKEYCDDVYVSDIEYVGDEFYLKHAQCDAWVFGDVLEHLVNPWEVLRKIKSVIPISGSVIACIPNMQHWTVQHKLIRGELIYQNSGLLDKTHLRWFTRKTIATLFDQAGFSIVDGCARIFDEPHRDKYLSSLWEMLNSIGDFDDQVIKDSMPVQYVVRAIPNRGNK